jgi:hypothetical protein
VVVFGQIAVAGDWRTLKRLHKPRGIPCEEKETLAQRKTTHASPNARPTAFEFLIIARSNCNRARRGSNVQPDSEIFLSGRIRRWVNLDPAFEQDGESAHSSLFTDAMGGALERAKARRSTFGEANVMRAQAVAPTVIAPTMANTSCHGSDDALKRARPRITW